MRFFESFVVSLRNSKTPTKSFIGRAFRIESNIIYQEEFTPPEAQIKFKKLHVISIITELNTDPLGSINVAIYLTKHKNPRLKRPKYRALRAFRFPLEQNT